MLQHTGEAITFSAFFTDEGSGATGLTVTVDVYRDGTGVVSDGEATEIGGGAYAYTLASGSVNAAGNYVCVFKTSDTADQAHLAALVQVGPLDNLDAAVSTRSSHGEPDLSGIATLLDRLSSVRAGLLDNLLRLDSDVSDCLKSAEYTEPDNDSIAALLARITSGRAALLDNLSRLDAEITSRLAASGYTAPDNSGIAAAKTAAESVDGKLTTARAAKLDRDIAHASDAATYKADVSALATAAKQDAAKVILDRVDGLIEDDGSGNDQFTSKALSQVSIDVGNLEIEALTPEQAGQIALIPDIKTQTDRFAEITPEDAPLAAIEAPDGSETRCHVFGYWRRLDRKDGKVFKVRFDLAANGGAKAGGYLLAGRAVELTGANGEISGYVERNDLIAPSGTHWLVTSDELGISEYILTLEESTFDLTSIVEEPDA